MTTIYTDILNYWLACWKGAVCAGLLGMLIGTHIYPRLKPCISFYLLFLADGIFLYYLLYVTLFSRIPGSRREVALLPFMGVEFMSGDFHYLTENILLFIPFGFLSAKTLAMCGKTCGIKAVLLASFMTSVSVEVLQYLSACGKSETEDIITNVLGAIIGYLFAKFVFRSVRK